MMEFATGRTTYRYLLYHQLAIPEFPSSLSRNPAGYLYYDGYSYYGFGGRSTGPARGHKLDVLRDLHAAYAYFFALPPFQRRIKELAVAFYVTNVYAPVLWHYIADPRSRVVIIKRGGGGYLVEVSFPRQMRGEYIPRFSVTDYPVKDRAFLFTARVVEPC